MYDDDLAHTNPIVDSGDSQVAMDMDMDACSPIPEVCNGKDDDCDGQADEEPETTAHCEMLFNATAACETGFCVKTGGCRAGFYNCDGKPENGCESTCPCTGCEDAGPDGG